jgi:hypothetical protein
MVMKFAQILQKSFLSSDYGDFLGNFAKSSLDHIGCDFFVFSKMIKSCHKRITPVVASKCFCQVSYAISLIYATYIKSLIYSTGATSNGCMPSMHPTETSKSVLRTKFS